MKCHVGKENKGVLFDTGDDMLMELPNKTFYITSGKESDAADDSNSSPRQEFQTSNKVDNFLCDNK